MTDLKWVKICVGSVIVYLMLFGFLAHSVSLRKGRFKDSHLMRLYSFAIATTFTMSYGRNMLIDLLKNRFNLENVIQLYSYMNIVAVIVNYLTALILSRTFVRFFNRVALYETIKFFDVNAKTLIVSVRLVLLKGLLIPVIYEVTLILQQIRNAPDKHLLWTFHTLLPMILSQMFPNLFFSALVICKTLMVSLNERLMEIVNEVNCLQNILQMSLQKPYYRMQRFCELADRLDLLAQKYDIICKQTTVYLHLLSAPLICSLLCNLCGITAGCFTQYLAIAETLVNNEPYDAFNALTNAVFLVISIVEVLLQGHICDDNRLKVNVLMYNKILNQFSVYNVQLQVQETGLILQRMNLTHADLRFKESVEAFSLLVLVTEYKIQPLGLLEINISLVQDVSSKIRKPI
uniref:Gustatory receptor n=1 Tax=Ceratitis capitata TaxID=7213 RepID=W8BZD0_CERCA